MSKAKRYEFTDRETKFQGQYDQSLLNTLYQAYRPSLLGSIIFILLGFIGRLCLLGNANLIGYWVDSYCTPTTAIACRPIPIVFQNLNSYQFLTLLVLATLSGFLLTVVFRIGISRISAHAVSHIYDETTIRTSRLPMSFYDRNPAGRIMTRFSSDYNNVFRIFGGPLAEFIGLVFDILAMTVLISIASPWFLPFWILQAGLNYGVYRLFLPSLRKERRDTSHKRSSGISHFSESVAGANTIRAFGRRLVFEKRFSELNDRYLVQKKNASKVFIFFSLSMGACTAFTFLLIGLTSVWLMSTGRLGVGAIGVAFTYIGLSSNVLQSFFDWLAQLEEAMTGLERLNEYMQLPLEPGAKLPERALFKTHHVKETPSNVVSLKKTSGVSIKIDNLHMRYREDLPLVLDGLSLSIAPGERLAIIGKTGSGKTSLIQSLFRLYPIEKGNIYIDHHQADVGDGGLDLAAYRSLISYITQEAILFVGTLRENLKASEDLSDSQLIQSLRRVSFLNPDAADSEYQHWLNFEIEERGQNFSVGERQLVCMARCLLQNTPVVILDEATSSVDPKSEEIITRATEEFFNGKTQIIVAHRLSTIRSCDRVLWLQNGKAHRLGTPHEVLQEFELSNLDI